MADVLIVDYGVCNLDSVKRTVELCGSSAECTDDPSHLHSASRVILPGVGSFTDAMNRIRQAGWHTALREETSKGLPLLGICLGMQLLATDGDEGAEDNVVDGLDLISGRIKMLKKVLPEERIPHMGWNELTQTRAHPLWENIPLSKDFYFANSYHFDPKDPAVAAGKTDYCGGFISAVGKGNIFGVQFHPEKSQKAGFQLIKNFLSWDGRDA